MGRLGWSVVFVVGGGLGVAACGKDDEGHGADPATGGAGGEATASTGGQQPGGATGTGGTPTACEPNATESCACASPVVGSRRCAADGSAWSACECVTYGANLAVSPTGSDAASGALDAPFATLGRAQEAVRELVDAGLPEGGVAVWIHGGTYPLDATFELGAADSGTSGRPVVYRGYPGEVVRLVGGTALEAADFAPVTSASPVWDRLDAEARDSIVAIDLGAQGITDYGALARRGFCGGQSVSPLELFVGGVPMTLGRWPDVDADDAPDLSGTADSVEVYGALTPDVSGRYTKSGEQDGVASYVREGLVGADQFYLYRRTWEYPVGETTHTAWFLTTDSTGYPTSNGPWWSLYDDQLGPLEPNTDSGAAGTVTFTPPTAIAQGFASVASADSDTVWHYAGDRPSRWTAADEVWFHGYWQYAWADCRQAAASIDPATQTVTFDQAPGYGVRAGMPYYAFNLLEELTQPGEYYVDRTSGILYLYPPVGFATAEVVVSMLEDPLVRLDGAQFVELRDVTLEAGRGTLVDVRGGSDNVLSGVTLRNAGANGATLSGTRNGIEHCVVANTATGGITLQGGDRPSLVPGENYAENCDIHHFGRIEWTYRPGVSLNGVGQRAAHNLIHDAPHSAVLYGGNEHLIELNEIHHVNQFSSDAGAVYAGRDWGARGNVIRHNFIHHVATSFAGYGVHGIYLDDCLSGIEVRGNVLYEIQDHGILHGGGRDNVFVGNVIAKCGTALSADSRGFDWRPEAGPNNVPGDSWNLLEKLNDVGYQAEPWASRYPACAAIPNDWNAIIADGATWTYPEGCVFQSNIGWQNDTFINGMDSLAHYETVSDNLEDADPGFVDEAGLDLTLRADSPAFALPDFAAIPFAEIGIE